MTVIIPITITIIVTTPAEHIIGTNGGILQTGIADFTPVLAGAVHMGMAITMAIIMAIGMVIGMAIIMVDMGTPDSRGPVQPTVHVLLQTVVFGLTGVV